MPPRPTSSWRRERVRATANTAGSSVAGYFRGIGSTLTFPQSQSGMLRQRATRRARMRAEASCLGIRVLGPAIGKSGVHSRPSIPMQHQIRISGTPVFRCAALADPSLLPFAI